MMIWNLYIIEIVDLLSVEYFFTDLHAGCIICPFLQGAFFCPFYRVHFLSFLQGASATQNSLPRKNKIKKASQVIK